MSPKPKGRVPECRPDQLYLPQFTTSHAVVDVPVGRIKLSIKDQTLILFILSFFITEKIFTVSVVFAQMYQLRLNSIQ